MTVILNYPELFWAHLTSSLSVQLFTLSAVVLLVGIALGVWSKAVKLTFLDSVKLNVIEFHHPHIPSLRAIVSIFLCSIALLIVAVHATVSVGILTAPYQSLYLAALFLLSATAGILAELKWKGAKEYPLSFIMGTSLAFVCLVMIYTIPENRPGLSAVLLALLISSTALCSWVLYPVWRKAIQVVSLLSFLFWILLLIATK